jgi:hypothetical protein
MIAASWALVGVTFALVVLNGWYAFTTWRLLKVNARQAEDATKAAQASRDSALAAAATVEEIKRQRESQFMPVLEGREAKDAEATQGTFRYVNTGAGPARNVWFRFGIAQQSPRAIPCIATRVTPLARAL